MPVTPPGIVGALVPNLLAVALVGTDVPKYASGVAAGLVRWIPSIRVTTTDAGSAGVGSNVPLPLPVPSPLLIPNLTLGMTSMGLIGPFMPVLVTGLANGLSVAFAQMLVKTTHPTVGTGSGVAKFVAPPATPFMVQGFSSVGMVGPSAAQKAGALGIGLDRTFASLVVPVAIVGSASPTGASGVGTGNIV